MTAAHATSTAKSAPKHAAPKPERKFGITRKSTKPVTQPKTRKARPAKAESVRLTPTGKAMFVVDHTGEASPTVWTLLNNRVATFAVTTGDSIAAANKGDWITQLFETEEQRKARVNAQAIGHIVSLAGAIVGALARR